DKQSPHLHDRSEAPKNPPEERARRVARRDSREDDRRGENDEERPSHPESQGQTDYPPGDVQHVEQSKGLRFSASARETSCSSSSSPPLLGRSGCIGWATSPTALTRSLR